MRITKSLQKFLPFVLVRDSQEQAGTGWKFIASHNKEGIKICGGTVVAPLDAGDYTIKGLEHVLRVERKGSTNDLVSSIASGRMKSQLERLSKFKYAYLVLEFDLNDLINWHFAARAMRSAGHRIPLSKPDAALSAFMKLHFDYPSVHIFFVGKKGSDFIRSLFKRVLEEYSRNAK